MKYPCVFLVAPLLFSVDRAFVTLNANGPGITSGL